ncbi:MAG: tRNA preQ1(34) S-adenosylmethionine ribosyltransferase-isomerase QueA [Oscillospiraceae bacterium]|jgi:S-adenosylmethionine:tRNA ribosyltransferase-isomerase|nr:tRNA preQ1(34) S-adenosylmethionine ribosyltransferase-isomerase QueA [Oscillospiraceae bacterium]
MKTSDFYYDLPPEFIAQHPAVPRDSSRLLVLNRTSGEITHAVFNQIGNWLQAGDCLVLNDTKVLPARLYGTKTSGAVVEFLLLKNLGNDRWECLAGPGKKAKPGDAFVFLPGRLSCVVELILPDGNRIIRFLYNSADGFYTLMNECGEMPLPHYITEKLSDPTRYNTVYAQNVGSAAAPTAGLHFTPELIHSLCANGIQTAYVTLHVGLGTFRPVKAENIENHTMHSEWYSISAAAASQINECKSAGGRIICVGTTSCRTIETAARLSRTQNAAMLRAHEAETSIFLYPGSEFLLMDGLVTNFHLPESTLIMLVSAFCGRENTLRAYKKAVAEGYRFYSFGDAMLIL